jgi:hypothetical protein
MTEQKLHAAIKACGAGLEKEGYRISLCAGVLKEVLDLTADSYIATIRDLFNV